MSQDQIPNVFAGLILPKGQHDLFDEVETEAIDLFVNCTAEHSGQRTEENKTILLDCKKYHLALSWWSSNESDILSLAIGVNPDLSLSQEDISEGTAMMSALFRRAKALFDVDQSMWQISILPITVDTMRSHAESLGRQSVTSAGAHFLAFKPNRAQGAAHSDPSISSSELLDSMQSAVDGVTQKPSLAMQMSALAISSAFVFVTPPVGIAMLTYAALRQASDMDLFANKADEGNPDQK